MKLGVSGVLTRSFIGSPLTPLLLLAALALGTMALLLLPREEEPQISVPMVDVLVRTDGLKAPDAVELVTKPLEDIVKGIDEVEHVYSQTVDDRVMVTARFFVGTDADRAILRVHQEIRAHLDQIPIGIPEPLIVGRGINDVPIVTLTLAPKPEAAARWTDNGLYHVAEELKHELVKIEDLGRSFIVGGRPDQIRVEPDPERLALYGVTLNQLVEKVKNANRSFVVGRLRDADRSIEAVAGQTLQGIPDIGLLLITTRDGRPVYVKDVADVVVGGRPDEHRAWHMVKGADGTLIPLPAVTLALAKRKGANAVIVAEKILERLELVRGSLIPADVTVTVTRDYEAKQDLLKTVDTQWGGVPVVRHDYTYDARYQRQTGKLSGSAFSDLYAGSGYSAVYHHYAYNARGELQTAAMYRGDTPSTTPSAADELPGRRYEYRYDGLGNRQSAGPTGAGADDVYETNALNQYDWKENNLVRVTGSVAASASGVLVKGTGAGATARKDRAWTAELLPANENQAVLGSATIYAALAGGGAGGLDLLRTETKSYFVPKSVQAFEYDADGNLTHDSVWDYVYDAENRLIQIQHRSEVIGTGKIASADARKLVFAYDYLGRRVRKTVYGGWNGSAYTGGALSDTKYLYDGWNLMVEFDALSGLTVKRAYTWGLDLTGSLTAAGGVGALLQVYDAAAGKTVLPAIDGSGNVMAMVNADTGALEAVYEYDPYGNLLRKEGKEGEPNYAVVNPIRFASKYTDEETGLVCYGTRYYAPSLGRFINRDTIGEEGGLNLYAYVSNRVPNAWDLLGMAEGEGAWISGVLGEDGIWRYTTEYAPTGMDMVEAGIRASGSIGWMSYAEGATASQLAAVVAYQTAQVNYAIGKVNDAAAAVIGNVTANAVNQATAAAAGYLANNAAQAIASIGSTAYAGLAAGQASYSASTAGAVAANFSAGQAPILAALDSRMMSMEEGMRYAPASTSSPLDNLSPAEYAATQGAIMAREQQRASQVKPFQAIAGSFAEKRAVLNGGANLVLAGTLAGVAAPTAILYAAPAVTTMIAGGKLAVPIVATDMTAMAQSAYVHAMVAAGTNTGQIILYSSLEVLGAKYGGAAMPYPEGTAAAALTTIYLGIIN